jgi:hypothetical protein
MHVWNDKFIHEKPCVTTTTHVKSSGKWWTCVCFAKLIVTIFCCLDECHVKVTLNILLIALVSNLLVIYFYDSKVFQILYPNYHNLYGGPYIYIYIYIYIYKIHFRMFMSKIVNWILGKWIFLSILSFFASQTNKLTITNREINWAIQCNWTWWMPLQVY